MKNYIHAFALISVLFGAGCCKKQNTKVALEQKETVAEHFVQEEKAANDKKEDYSIVA